MTVIKSVLGTHPGVRDWQVRPSSLELRDPLEPRCRARRGARTGALGAGRRPDQPHDRPDMPSARPQRRLHRAARLRQATRSTSPSSPTLGRHDLPRRAACLRRLAPSSGSPAVTRSCSIPMPSDFIEAGDELIVIAEDNSTIHTSAPGRARHRRDQCVSVGARGRPERTLVLGYNSPCPGNARGPRRLRGARVIGHRRGRHGRPRRDLPGRPDWST